MFPNGAFSQLNVESGSQMVEEKGGADRLHPVRRSSTQKHGKCGPHTNSHRAPPERGELEVHTPFTVRTNTTALRLRHNHMQMWDKQPPPPQTAVHTYTPTHILDATIPVLPSPPHLWGGDKQNCADR